MKDRQQACSQGVAKWSCAPSRFCHKIPHKFPWSIIELIKFSTSPVNKLHPHQKISVYRADRQNAFSSEWRSRQQCFLKITVLFIAPRSGNLHRGWVTTCLSGLWTHEASGWKAEGQVFPGTGNRTCNHYAQHISRAIHLFVDHT